MGYGHDDPQAYTREVEKVCELLKLRKHLERGGKIHQGWMEACFDLNKQVKQSAAKFPGMDLDLVDDAYRMMVGAYHGRG